MFFARHPFSVFQLLVPDLFKRLDQWHQLKRNSNESIPQFLVREEDMFVQLQDALRRARSDGRPDPTATVSGNSDAQRGPSSTPSQGPIGRAKTYGSRRRSVSRTRSDSWTSDFGRTWPIDGGQ